MQYNSWLYLFPFLGGSLILYYLLPIKRRWIGLLFSSLLFYILTMKSLVVVVLFTTAAIYLGARVIEQFNETFIENSKYLFLLISRFIASYRILSHKVAKSLFYAALRDLMIR